MKRLAGLALVLALLASPAIASAQIGSGGDRWVGYFGWGTGIDQTWGQTIQAPTDAIALSDFSFWLGGFTKPTDYKAYVYAWDESLKRATGGSLWASEVMSGPGGDFWTATKVTASPNVAVNAGAMYVMFFSVSDVAENEAGGGYNVWGLSYPTGEYAGGSYFWQANGTAAGTWTTQAWSPINGAAGSQGSDLRFEANFTATPEPASLMLLATGLIGVVGGAMRRRARRAEA